MSTYALPQVSVFQDIAGTPTESIRPLRPVYVGGNAVPVRFDVAEEREHGRLGYYDPAVDVAYPWPSRPAGGVVDLGNARLYCKDALLQYFDAPIDSGPAVVKAAGYPNRVRGAALAFATANGYARTADLNSRDVTPGDVVRVRGVGTDGAFALWTYVRRLWADKTAAVVGAAAADASNAATHLAGATVTFIAGDINTVSAAASAAAYDGLASGFVSETYTVIVLEGSLNGDLTTARLRVLSASGTDDVPEVTPSASGVATALGTRGATITFTINHDASGSDSAEAEHVSPDDLVAGQQWRVALYQAFTAPVATSGGTYSGASDLTYIVEVSKGGVYADGPQVRVATATGGDGSGPTTVPGPNVAVPVGTKGATIRFSGSSLRKGDRYYVTATAAADGAVRTIELGHNLPAGVDDGERVGVTCFVRRTVEVGRDRTGYAPLTNWGVSATQLTTKAGAVVFQPDFYDGGGAPVPLPLVSAEAQGWGALYADYRAWVPTLTTAVHSVLPSDALTAIPGPYDESNPLKYAIKFGRANSNREDAAGDLAIKLLAVADPSDHDSWQAALDKLASVDGFYGLVPLTDDPVVLSMFQAHVEALSTPEEGLWRRVWVGLPGFARVPVVHAGSTVQGHTAATTSDGNVCLCVIEDDPDTAGTQYTKVRCPAGNSAFVTNGVTPGLDKVRTYFADDGFGNESYQEFVVDAVDSEDQLRLVSGPAAPQSVAIRLEVWRDLDAEGEAAEVGKVAGAYGSSRVIAVWPDVLEADGTQVPAYYACAALAALTGAVLPHQGVTRMALAGFDAVPRTTVRFNKSQLNAMAKAGAFIVTQDPATGEVYVRHAVTTGGYDDVALREEMRNRNRDSVSYRFRDHYSPYIGVANAVESVADQLTLDFKVLREKLLHEYETPLLGGQLVEMTLVRIGTYLGGIGIPDGMVLVAECTEPNPLNQFYVHQVIK